MWALRTCVESVKTWARDTVIVLVYCLSLYHPFLSPSTIKMTDNIEIVREADKIKTTKFPKKTPSRTEILNIVQIDYHFGKTAPARHLIHVKASNNLQAGAYPWRFVPRYYAPILALMFLRLELLKKAATDHPDSGGDAMHIKCAQRCLVNLDSVLDILWEDARVDYDNGRMDDTWRDATFERWLCIEIMIGNHAPEAVEQWIALDPQNKDALDRRSDNLGMFSIHICISKRR
jgi:hypothetical protein